MEIRVMTVDDYDEVVSLWRSTPGVVVHPVTDSRMGIDRLLVRNPGLSFVAFDEGELVGCALASHDGRRGFLQHIVVVPAMRGKALGPKLVALCLERLKRFELPWVYLEVAAQNEQGLAFWNKLGWRDREGVIRLALATPTPGVDHA